MKISLSRLIHQYYDKVGYISTSYTKSGKQALRVENIDFAKTLITHYDNLKLVYAKSQYAPEQTKAFIMLK